MFGIPAPPFWVTIVAGIGVITLGIAYIVQTRNIVRDFKFVLNAHRRILAMALVSQGLSFCFIGALVVVFGIFAPFEPATRTVLVASAVILLILSVWTGSTGGQTEYMLLRASHLITIVAAGLMLLGALPK